MISNKTVKIFTTHHDRCARNGSLQIGDKAIPFHTVAPLVKNELDLDAYAQVCASHPTESVNTKMIVLPLTRYNEAIKPLITRVNSLSMTLDGYDPYQSEKNIVKTAPILIDPCMDYTWYMHHRKALSKNSKLPRELQVLLSSLISVDRQEKQLGRSTANKMRKTLFEDFWFGLLSSSQKLESISDQILRLQHELGADIGLPPVLPVYNSETFKAAKEINKISKAVWEGEDCAKYILLDPTAIHNEELINDVLDYFGNADSKLDVLKIKNLELDKSSHVSGRNTFRMMMERINLIKEDNRNKAFMMLEAGPQFYPALAGGFDVVSTSLGGLDKDSNFGRGGGMGGWYDPKELVTRPIKDVRNMLKSYGRLPCNCPICRSITSEPQNQNIWNQQRRMHYFCATGRISNEINTCVIQDKIELASQRLLKSSLSNFQSILPLS